MFVEQDTVADELDSGGGECHPAVDRMVSMESGATSDSWDDDYQDYYDEEVTLKLNKTRGLTCAVISIPEKVNKKGSFYLPENCRKTIK